MALLKVKEEAIFEDEFETHNLWSNEGDCKAIKQEYHCKEEIDLDWDERDNNYAESESEAFVKSNGEYHVKTLRASDVTAQKPSRGPNALPKLIKRSCPKCNHLTEITKSFLYRKKKCIRCQNESLQFECVKCCKRYSHYDSVRYHVLTKCNPINDYYRCDQCSYKVTYEAHLARHVRRVHERSNNGLKCTICGKTFKYNYSLKRHLKKSCGLKFPRGFVQCENCDRKFKNEDYLKRHEKACRQEVMLTCYHCGYESKHKRRLILHLRNKHSDMAVE